MFALIREQDLLDAIAECQGERNPDARTCIKLAAFYTILNNMHYVDGQPPVVTYSQSAEPPEQVSYDSGSEFSDAITGLPVNQILPVIDELLDAVHMISPKLYNATIVRLRTL